MPRLFSAAQLRRCAEAAHVLASPRPYPDVDAWRRDAAAVLRRAFGADHAFVQLPGVPRRLVGDGVDEATLERLARYTTDAPEGSRYLDPRLQRLHQRRREIPEPVFTRAGNERAMGRPMDGTEVWDAVVRPAGMLHFQGAYLARPGGDAMLWISRERPSRAALLGEDAVPLLELLVPAFRAGVEALPRPAPCEPADEVRARFALTPREAEVALLVARGHTAKRVAAELGISVHTAARHTERVLAKLGVSTRAAAAHRIAGGG